MTDKPTPKEIDDLVYELRQAGKDDTYSLVCAVLAKWSTPAPVGVGEVAEHYRNAIASACEGWTMPDGLRKHLETALWSPPTPQPTQPQAGAMPLDEARRMFDAGWKAAALFCDREDVVADGTIGFGACPQFEAAFSAAQPVAREPLTPERVKEIVRGAGYDQCGIPDTERAAFINGLRHGEHVHGIKGGQHGTDT